ncbi:MAG TPA: hypothetical protein VGH29_17815 [Candidatus Binataceae bacterium]
MSTKLVILAGGAVLWLALVGAGSAVLLNYALTPGVSGAAPAQWPPDSALRRNRNEATLLMVVHPHCTCSRASLSELSALMSGSAGKVSGYVLFVRPPGMARGWEHTGLWRQAAAIPGVTLISDEAGHEAARFGAETSGQTMLYDRGGALEFSGGITAARGHYGANAGSAAIVALLGGVRKGGSGRRTPVYGCPLLGRGTNVSTNLRIAACKR